MDSRATLKNALHFFGGVGAVLFGHLLFLGVILLGVMICEFTGFRPSKDPYWQIGVLLFGLMGIGIFQIIYVLPLSLYFKRKGKKLILQGILISAALTLLGSGICGGMMWR
jgi:hypothetical protein